MARIADPNAREALITAARHEFVRVGIQRARIEDITRACGLSKGAFYLHFASKEALLRGVVKELEVRIESLHTERMQTFVDTVGTHPLPKLKKMLTDPVRRTEFEAIERSFDVRTLKTMWEWRDIVDLLLRGAQGTEFEDVLWQVVDRELGRVRDFFGFMEAAHLVRGGLEPDIAGSMLVGTWLLLARQMVQRSAPPDFERWVDNLRSVLSVGMAPQLKSPAAARSHRAPPRRTTPSPSSKTTKAKRSGTR